MFTASLPDEKRLYVVGYGTCYLNDTTNENQNINLGKNTPNVNDYRTKKDYNICIWNVREGASIRLAGTLKSVKLKLNAGNVMNRIRLL